MSGLPFRIRNPLNKLKNTCSEFQSKDKLLSLVLTSKLPHNLKNTPLQFSSRLSAKLNSNIFLKREDLQPTFSFYVRGCMNELQNIDTELAVTSSIGSRGYCLAYCAQQIGIKSKVFMPESTSCEKKEMIQFFDSEVILHGQNINETNKYLQQVSQRSNYTVVGSHSENNVIAGCGTIALELLQQLPHVDAVFIPVGGGSLIAGITHVIKSLHPQIQVVGVEYEKQNILHDSLMKGYRVQHQDPGLHGIAVSQIHEKIFNICDEYLDDIILVTEEEIHQAIKSCFIDTRTVIEPHGALSVAGVHKFKQKGCYVCIISDAANLINFDNIHSMYTL